MDYLPVFYLKNAFCDSTFDKQPDQLYGMGKLQAVKSVFGTNATRHGRDGNAIAPTSVTYDATQPHGLPSVEAPSTAQAASSTSGSSAAPVTPVVGAIRWDAYFSQPGMAAYEDPNFGIVTRTTTVDLSPAKWHYRVPFFGKEVNDTAVIVNGNSPEVMGQELEYAASHGIQFWSFCNCELCSARKVHLLDHL